jgi:class 3 adenylate cyclase
MKLLYLITLSIFSFLIVSCNSNQKIAPKAVKGVLDLRNWDFEKDGIIKLDGEWEFYWQQFLTSKDFDTVQNKHFINVPDVWNDYDWNGQKLSGTGFSSYKLTILINKSQQDLAFRILNCGTAYNLLINNSLYKGNGKVSNTKESESSQYLPKIFHINSENDTLSLLVHVSNFHYRKGGIWYSIDFGNLEKIISLRELLLSIDLLLIGSQTLLACYLFILFFYRNKEIPALLLGFGLIFSVLRVSSTNEIFLMSLFPSLNFDFLIKIELGSLYLALACMLIYPYVLFKQYCNKKMIILFQFLMIGSFFIVILFPPKMSSEIVPSGFIFILFGVLYGIFVSIKAMLNRQFGGLLLFISFSIGLTTWIIDFLVVNNYINLSMTAPFSWIAINIGQAIILSKKFANEFIKIESFAQELEDTVEVRTQELKIEKEKTEELLKQTDNLLQQSDKLLLNVLPESIATRLKSGETQIADHFEEASVIFIDIADFTVLSSKSTPQAMVKMLNEIFTIFDKIAAKHGLEKIKTIGDCYMAAAGIPIPRKDHAEAIAMMAMEVMETMKGYWVSGIGDRVSGILEEAISSYTPTPITNTQKIQFRIGLDCGPIVAGVIGEQKFIYDLWGDMVNTASRMESNGVVGKIQVTERFKEKISNIEQGISNIEFEERGMIEIKGKGKMRTYFLKK